MTDNVVASAAVGVGATFATDDIAGVMFPRSKLVWGADGTATDASAAAPLPVVQTGAMPAGTNAIGKLAANSGVDIGTVTANAGSNLNTSALALDATLGTTNTEIGGLTETAPASDTASSGLNGRLQRVAQRLTSLIALLPAALTGSGNLKIALVESTATATVSGTVTANAGTNLNTSALALDATLATTNTDLGGVTETAPATDTASSGLNGRLQRIAQRVTSLIALLPSALVGGRLDVNTGSINGVATTMGNGVSGTGVQRVTLASDSTGQVALAAGSATIGALTANQSINAAQLAGTTTDTNSGNKSAGTLRVVLATDQPALTNKLLVTPDANSAVNCAQMNGVTVTMGNGVSGTGVQRVTLASDGTGQVAIATGSNTIGNVGTVPVTSGGCSVSSFLSTAAVQSTAIKASAGQVYSVQFFNLNAAARYVRLYNQTTAPATTDTANIVWRGMIPGNTAGAGFVAEFPNGLAFSTGIGMRVTAAVADNDGTALAANEIMGNVSFK